MKRLTIINFSKSNKKKINKSTLDEKAMKYLSNNSRSKVGFRSGMRAVLPWGHQIGVATGGVGGRKYHALALAGQKAGEMGGTVVGGGTGLLAGAIKGGAIGSVVGPVGTVIGAGLGGVLGGATGAWLGSNVGGYVGAKKAAQLQWDLVNKKKTTKKDKKK